MQVEVKQTLPNQFLEAEIVVYSLHLQMLQR